MSKIVILKMTNGSELIATTDNAATQHSHYHKIREFHVTQQGAALVPWIMCAPDVEVEILEGIAAIINAPVDIEKQYLSVTSSIQLM